MHGCSTDSAAFWWILPLGLLWLAWRLRCWFRKKGNKQQTSCLLMDFMFTGGGCRSSTGSAAGHAWTFDQHVVKAHIVDINWTMKFGRRSELYFLWGNGGCNIWFLYIFMLGLGDGNSLLLCTSVTGGGGRNSTGLPVSHVYHRFAHSGPTRLKKTPVFCLRWLSFPPSQVSSNQLRLSTNSI